MKKLSLCLTVLMAALSLCHGQVDLSALNKPAELVNEANRDIENREYKAAVQKLVAAARLDPHLREIYISMNVACSYTDQTDILKDQLKKATTYLTQDDELYYYLGNIYQNEGNLAEAIKVYSKAIEFGKINGEDFELIYAYYLNRGNCYIKQNDFAKAIIDYNQTIKLKPDAGATYVNRGIALYKTGKRKEACDDWKKAKSLGMTNVNQYLARYCK